MKRFLLICIFSLPSFFGFANDTYFFMAGGNLVPAEEKDTLLVKTSDNTFEILLYDVEPENYTDIFEVEISDVINDDGPRSFPGYFPYNKKIVDKKEFKWLRKDQLRIVRNAIYALHGYKFKSKELEEYCTEVGQYWNPPYKVNPDFSEDELTEIEKVNIKKLLEEEKRR